MTGLHVGVDIGGTFTDVAIEDGGGGRWSVKVPTTPVAPDDGVLDGLTRGLAAAGASLGDVALLVHGTTLATNALIERKGATTALLTTAGFRDIVEIGNEGRFDQYDLGIVKPAPLVPRALRFEADERLGHDGRVIAPLDDDSVRRAAAAMAAAGVKAVAITFLHAYADGAHEARARDLIVAELGDIAVSVSHEVSPEMREYERTSTTCANAYLQPLVGGYLLRLEARLHAAGLVPPMLMMLSSGSLTTTATAARFPIRLLESGPAGGAIFAGDIARRLGLARVLSFDVGGTTAKFCLIDDGEARQAQAFEVARTYRFKKGSGLPIRVPVVDLVEIGAGGGSVARLDAVGRVTVGPDSAGSEPGPACYGRGGTRPTVTDADLILGKLDPVAFAGGTMPLDVGAATDALGDLCATAGLPPASMAFAVTEVVTESMAAAARVHAAEVGTDVTARTVIAFGGGAPLHAARFAAKLGIDEVIVPAGAGVGSAIGFLRAPVAFELVRTARLELPDGDPGAAWAVLTAMEAEARTIVGGDAPVVRRGAYMRYVGQGHEIEVVVPPRGGDFAAALHTAFEAAYRRLYGQPVAGNPVEVTSWTVRVQHPVAAVAVAPTEVPPHRPVPARTQQVFDGDARAWRDRDAYDRAALAPGAAGQGPAVIAEAETTTIVPGGFDFRIDAEGFIRLTRRRTTP